MEEKLEIIDKKYMQRALQLALLGGVQVAPNPKVGTVIVYNDTIIGEGYHKEYGAPHAEVNAIASVKADELLPKSTIYVTLEPCAHFGKTPPCADLIVKKGFQRVVIATTDPNSKVAGKGIERIKAAGISVTVGVLEEAARTVNKRFFTFLEQKRPYVILKWAETRDGFMDRLPEERNAGINWITDKRLKLNVHQWRSEEQAIMVGWKTIANDNPQLNVRKLDVPSPHRFVIDPHGRAPTDAVVFNDGNPTTVFTLENISLNVPKHVQHVQLPSITSKHLLHALYQLGILSVFIEGGTQTLHHFIADNLWDEAYQLIGNTTFQKGIPAPLLSHKILLSSASKFDNLIMHFAATKNGFVK